MRAARDMAIRVHVCHCTCMHVFAKTYYSAEARRVRKSPYQMRRRCQHAALRQHFPDALGGIPRLSRVNFRSGSGRSVLALDVLLLCPVQHPLISD